MSNTNERKTDSEIFLSDLDGGVFKEKLEYILSEVALAVTNTEKKGQVAVIFDFEKIKNSQQVQIGHELKYKKPKERGQITETDKRTTPMHVNRGGRMTFFAEDQTQMFTKTGAVNTTN